MASAAISEVVSAPSRLPRSRFSPPLACTSSSCADSTAKLRALAPSCTPRTMPGSRRSCASKPERTSSPRAVEEAEDAASVLPTSRSVPLAAVAMASYVSRVQAYTNSRSRPTHGCSPSGQRSSNERSASTRRSRARQPPAAHAWHARSSSGERRTAASWIHSPVLSTRRFSEPAAAGAPPDDEEDAGGGGDASFESLAAGFLASPRAIACSSRTHALGELCKCAAAASAAALPASPRQPRSSASSADMSWTSSGVGAFSSLVASSPRRVATPGRKKPSTPPSMRGSESSCRTAPTQWARRAPERRIGAEARPRREERSWPVVARIDGAQSSSPANFGPLTSHSSSACSAASAASRASSLVDDGPQPCTMESAWASWRKTTSSCTGWSGPCVAAVLAAPSNARESA